MSVKPIVFRGRIDWKNARKLPLRFWYRRYLGWVPVQFCMVCGKPYWGGVPRFGLQEKTYNEALRLIYTEGCRPWWQRIVCTWQPWWMDYCSKKCADEDLDQL